jgi:hypothetical protein
METSQSWHGGTAGCTEQHGSCGRITGCDGQTPLIIAVLLTKTHHLKKMEIHFSSLGCARQILHRASQTGRTCSRSLIWDTATPKGLAAPTML